MSTSLDTEVRAALERRRGDWQQIAKGAEVSHSWISQFVRNKIPNPGYATLMKLHAELGIASGLWSSSQKRRRRQPRDEANGGD